MKCETILRLCSGALIGVAFALSARADDDYNYKPDGGYVSRSDIAIPIAEIVLKSIYGNETINKEKPLIAKLRTDSVWVITGTFACKRIPGRYCMGGVAEIWIAKSDGRILRVLHGE